MALRRGCKTHVLARKSEATARNTQPGETAVARTRWSVAGLKRRRLSKWRRGTWPLVTCIKGCSPDERSDIRGNSDTIPDVAALIQATREFYFAPIRPSVPDCSRLMFSLCFQNKSSVSTTNSDASAGWPNHHRNSGVTKAATSADREE